MNDKSEMEKLLALSLDRHHLIPDGSHVLVAVSGGVDSVSLLFALISLAVKSPGFRVSAAHLDHGLRPSSSQDADFVRQLCHDWGVVCHVDRVDVESLARRSGRCIEEAGRDARREFLSRVARGECCDRIALAHHQDDQAETVLLRMARGCAVSGLAAMAWQHELFIRPLLNVSRRAIEAYRQQNKLPFVEDATNSDVKYSRNRIRHEVIPSLRLINPEVPLQLSRLAQHVELEESYWQELVCSTLDACSFWRGTELRLCCDQVVVLHQALRQRVIRECLKRVRGDLRCIEAIHIELVDGLLGAGRPQLQLDLPSSWVARRYDVLVFRARPPEPSDPCCVKIDCDGRYYLPDGSFVEVVTSDCAQGETPFRLEFDADQLALPLYLRTVRTGDKMACVGMSGRKKVKNLFIENCIEQEQRARSLVLENEQGLLWLLGVRRSGICCVGEKTIRVLSVTLTTKI